jgi:FeS assembly SUF system regulator
MLKISKLTDYALILLVELKENEVFSASFLSQKTKIPLATTNKILKLLVKGQICLSKSGVKGGFSLNTNPHNISLLEVIEAIENTIPHLTECSKNDNICQLKNHCKISVKMNIIDKEIHTILSNKSIADLL